MNIKNSIIDQNRLELLLSFSQDKESKKLNKRVNALFKGFSKDTLKFVELLDRFNDPTFNSDLLEDYTVGERKIYIIRKPFQLTKAVKDIKSEKFIGFDTEQKPTYNKGEKQKDISIIQIATNKSCYIFQMKYITNIAPIVEIIANKNIKKVGFDLRNDNKEMIKQFKITPNNIFDLSPFMKKTLLHKHQIGVKNSVSLILQKKMQKSKRVVLSNWENDRLTESQIKYASEDATAPYDIYKKLSQDFTKLFNMGSNGDK